MLTWATFTTLNGRPARPYLGTVGRVTAVEVWTLHGITPSHTPSPAVISTPGSRGVSRRTDSLTPVIRGGLVAVLSRVGPARTTRRRPQGEGPEEGLTAGLRCARPGAETAVPVGDTALPVRAAT